MAILSSVISKGVIASRPAAGHAGNLYASTDESPPTLYRDNGSSWDAIADLGGGGGGGGAAIGARVKRASGDSTAASGTATAIAFTAEDFDTDAFHDNSSNNTRLTVPSGKAGKYLIGGQLYAEQNCDIYVRLNGTTMIAFGRAAGGDSGIIAYVIDTAYALSVGDYLELCATGRGASKTVYYDAGISPVFWMLHQGT